MSNFGRKYRREARPHRFGGKRERWYLEDRLSEAERKCLQIELEALAWFARHEREFPLERWADDGGRAP